MNKEEAGEGKWAWQAKNIQEISEIWKKYFLEIECEKKLENSLVRLQQEVKQKEVNINVSESPKVKEISSKKTYKFLKLENIRITSKQATKRANHYRVNYLDKWQNSGWFFLDGYFRDKKELIQPNLVGDFLLVRGYKYQFFYGFG